MLPESDVNFFSIYFFLYVVDLNSLKHRWPSSHGLLFLDVGIQGDEMSELLSRVCLIGSISRREFLPCKARPPGLQQLTMKRELKKKKTSPRRDNIRIAIYEYVEPETSVCCSRERPQEAIFPRRTASRVSHFALAPTWDENNRSRQHLDCRM